MTKNNIWNAGTQDTTVDVLRRAVAKWGDKPFLDILGDQCTFRQLEEYASISELSPSIEYVELAGGYQNNE